MSSDELSTLTKDEKAKLETFVQIIAGTCNDYHASGGRLKYTIMSLMQCIEGLINKSDLDVFEHAATCFVLSQQFDEIMKESGARRLIRSIKDDKSC